MPRDPAAARDPHLVPRRWHRLEACRRSVDVARERLHGRSESVRELDMLAARADLLDALEQYASAVTAVDAPVPRRVVADLALYRALGDVP